MPTPKVSRRGRVTARREANKRHDVGAPNKRPASGGKGNGKRPNAALGFAERHPFLSLAFAIIGALALIAVFTPTGESGSDGDGRPIDVVQNNGDAERIAELQEDIDILAQALIDRENEPDPTATNTPEPTATPCPAPTFVACEAPATPAHAVGHVADVCRTVTALMRTVAQGFDPDGELPSPTLIGKLGKVNDSVCRAPTTASDADLCLAVSVAVDVVFERADKEPNVLSLEQMDTLRAVVESAC